MERSGREKAPAKGVKVVVESIITPTLEFYEAKILMCQIELMSTICRSIIGICL